MMIDVSLRAGTRARAPLDFFWIKIVQSRALTDCFAAFVTYNR